MAITIASRKQKARNLQNYVAQKLCDWTNRRAKRNNTCVFTVGKDCDFQGREMGQSGVDVRLSPLAKDICPFDVECKAVERIALWESWKQCEDNAQEGRIPMLVVKRSRANPLVVMDLDQALELMDHGR